MVELNEKAEEVVFCPNCGWNSAMDGEARPAHGDGLVGRFRYRVENPSAWDTFDQGGSDLIAEAAIALQSKGEQIVRLTRERDEALDRHSSAVMGEIEATQRAASAEQQVQKLTAENEQLREAHASKASEFRDSIALGASPDEILRFRDGYPNPAGGSRVLFRYTIEQARYRYADAVLAARSALETQEGGE